MKICSRYGSENEDYVKFCVQCGKSFDNTDNHFEVVEEPSLIKKIFYKFDEEKHKYRIAKIKSFLVVEAVAIFIWAFNDLWFYIDSSKGDIFVSLIAALCIVVIFIILSAVGLFIIKKIYQFLQSHS